MSLNSYQEYQLIVIEAGLLQSAPHLAAIFGVFGRVSAGEAMPTWEQVPLARDRFQRAVIRILVAIAAVAAALGVLADAFLDPSRRYQTRPRPGARTTSFT